MSVIPTPWDAIANMKDGEAFVYLHSTGDHKIVQEEELGQVFSYKGFIHVSAEDHAQKFHLALEHIAEQLDGIEWTPQTLEIISAIVQAAGYTVREPNSNDAVASVTDVK